MHYMMILTLTRLVTLSQRIDELWQHYEELREMRSDTTDPLNIFGCEKISIKTAL